VEGLVADAGVVTFADLPAGHYRVLSNETALAKKQIDILVECDVDGGDRPMRLRVEAKRRAVVPVQVEIVAAGTNTNINGRLLYARAGRETQTAELTGPITLTLAADDAYTLAVEPESSRAKRVELPARLPRDIPGGALRIEVPVTPPALTLTWNLPAQKLDPQAQIFPIVTPAKGEIGHNASLQARHVDPAAAENRADAPDLPHFRRELRVYDLPDGDYTLDATVGRALPPAATLALVSPMAFHVEKGLATPATFDLKFSDDRVGSLTVTVVDDAGNPVAGASVAFTAPDGTVKANAPTDAAGRFETGPFLTGRYVLQVDRANLPAIRQPLELRKGPSTLTVRAK
jgi:hypothetical protein